MTPVEQGQERWTIYHAGGDKPGKEYHVRIDGPMTPVPTEVVPASDLEIAQRFCDEVVDELARVREAADTTWLERAEAAETAQDEAVKREKALVEALELIATTPLSTRLENGPKSDPREHLVNLARAALDQSGKGARR